MRAFSLFALALLLASLAAYVWRARPDSPINLRFGLVGLSIGGWTIGIAGVEAGTQTELFGRITFASASFIAAALLAFARVFPATSIWPPRFAMWGVLSGGTIFASLSLLTPLIAFDISRTSAGIQRTPGPLYPAYSLYLLTCTIIAFGILIAKWRRARGLGRAQLQYLGTGLLIFAAGATTTNLFIPILTGRSPYSWLGPYFTVPLVVLVGHSIIRHRLMDLRPVIGRGLVYAIAVAFTSALAISGGRLFLPIWRSEPFPSHIDILSIAFATLAMLSTPVQRLLGNLIDPYLFRGRIDYSVALRQATSRLSHLMEPTELSHQLHAIFTEAYVPESFAMFLYANGDTVEELLVDNNNSMKRVISTPAFTSFLQSEPVPTIIVASALVPGRHIPEDLHKSLRAHGIELIIGLGRRGQRLGTVLLGPRRSGDVYFTKDLAFIESISQLASIALENALLYRQRIQILEYSDRLLEALDAAVVAIDAEARLTSFNKAATALVGLAPEHRGQTFDVLPSQISWALAIAIRHPELPPEVEANIEHKHRGLVPVIVSTAVLRNERQEATGALAVITDLSMVKTLERNQQRMERLDMMARFYAGIAHEIRSPLTAISNFVAMLPDRFEDPEYRETAGRLLPLEVSRIARLAERLRLMAPSEDGKLNAVSLASLLSDLVAMHGPSVAEHGVRLSLITSPDLPDILGDRGQIVQLLVNLINNAVDAMPAGGLVRIELDHDKGQFGGRVRLRVIDEGVGIAPSLSHKIFQPFFTTKQAGTGLGLPICREIADFHHAGLSLLPRMDSQGTVAIVEFPSFTPGVRHRSAPPFSSTQSSRTRKAN